MRAVSELQSSQSYKEGQLFPACRNGADFRKDHVVGIIKYVAFSDGLLSLRYACQCLPCLFLAWQLISFFSFTFYFLNFISFVYTITDVSISSPLSSSTQSSTPLRLGHHHTAVCGEGSHMCVLRLIPHLLSSRTCPIPSAAVGHCGKQYGVSSKN